MLPTPYYDDGQITIYHADCRDILPHLSPGSVDLVLTDPPYGIANGSAFVRRGGEAVEDNGQAGWNALVPWGDWISGAFDALASGRYIATFHDMAQIEETIASIRAAGFSPWRRFFIVKTAPAPTPRPTFMSAVEECVIGFKGEREWWGGGATPNRWIGLTPNRLGTGLGHPSEKPVGAMAQIIDALSPSNGLVLDPFMGSGTTLRAAKDLGRRAIGIEIEERYCEIAVRRLQQAVLPLDIPA